MKYKIFTVIAFLGSTVAELFGGWDTALKTLLILRFWTGLQAELPGCVPQTPKSLNERESRAGWKAAFAERNDLLYVLTCAFVWIWLWEGIQEMQCIGFIANEVLSIVENAGMMGVPMPSMIKKAVDILKDTAESGAR